MRGSVTPTRPVGRASNNNCPNSESASRRENSRPSMTMYSAVKNLVIETQLDSNIRQSGYSPRNSSCVSNECSAKPFSDGNSKNRIGVPSKLVLQTNMDHLNINISQPSFNLTSPDTLFGSIQNSSNSNQNEEGCYYDREKMLSEGRNRKKEVFDIILKAKRNS